MRDTIRMAVLGVLAGAATLAGGGENDGDLHARLERLRELAAQAMEVTPPPPGAPAASEYGLAILPIQDLTEPRADFIPPTPDVREDDDERPCFGGMAEEAPSPFGTAEELVEHVRSNLPPRDADLTFAIFSGPTVLLRGAPTALQRTADLLDGTLRPAAHRCVTVEAALVSADAATARAMVAGDEGAIDAAMRSAKARILFAGRVTAFAGERVYVWRGAQTSILNDYDVEVAQGSSVADPVVSVVPTGDCLCVKAALGDDPGRITLDLDFWHAESHGAIRAVSTKESGSVDVPSVTKNAFQANVVVGEHAWTAVGEGPGEGDRQNVLLVRASSLERKGGAR